MNYGNNQNNNGCGCNCNPNPAPAPADISMSVCDRNINMLPMLQTYTTKVLKPNIEGCCRKNILTQQMMNCEGYKYVIKWDFDLDGKTITVPSNCILEFDGGSLKNGTIVGQNTLYINVGDTEIWGKNLIIEGTWREKQGGGISDKEYNPENYSGLGRKTLQLKDGSNILTQDDFDQENTIYVIVYDFDLDGKTIEFPEGCILDFEGGSLDNGTIILENTGIRADRYQIFKDDLNIISYKREIGVPSGLQPERKRTLYATWFGLRGSEDSENADVFAKVLTTLRNNGKLIVDTDIYIEKPVVVRDLFYTIIEGETGNNSINVCIPTIYSKYVPSEETNLFEFYSEGLQLRNLRISWGKGDDDTDGGRNPQAVVYVRPRGGLAEIDCVIENCQIDNYKYGETINAQGRGLYIQNNILHHTFWNSAEVNALIKIVGYSIDDDREFFRPKDGNRATVIKNNRFHVANNYYMVWFVQDPENPNSTFSNTLIEGNLCDYGCSGIHCDSRMRGLVVTNNIFSVKRRAGNAYSFNYFTNSINGLVFANNVITTVEEPDDGTELNNAGETWFKYTDSNVEFENINISNNTFDIPNMARLVHFDGREYKSQDNEKYPIVRQLNVCNNTFSDRCFVSGSSNWNYICSFLNCNLHNSSIISNCVVDCNDPKDVRSAFFDYIKNEAYPARTIDNRRSIIAMNAGTSLDILFEGVSPTDLMDITTTDTLRPIQSSIPWAFRSGIREGVQMWNITFKKPSWFRAGGWIDSDGYSDAPKKGTSADRPTMLLKGLNDSGFTYFDSTLNKQIVYKSSDMSWIVNHAETELDTETGKYKTEPIHNTLVEGKSYLFSCNEFYEHHVYFYNSNDPSVQRIDVIEQMCSLGYTDPYVQLNKFIAPDPSVYDTIVVEVGGESTVSILGFDEWWEEQDGAKAGVSRSGTFAQAPAAADIYEGFMYMLNDGSSHFPIYASISGSPATVTWYKADGTQYNE